jgi:hypothetical protein
MANTKSRHVASVPLTPEQNLFIERFARSIGKTKAATLRMAAEQFKNRIERNSEEQKTKELLEELKGFRKATWVALRQLSFISAQNLHLVSTLFTDALPAELSGLSDEQWEKLWEESRDWAKKYLELLDKNLQPS